MLRDENEKLDSNRRKNYHSLSDIKNTDQQNIVQNQVRKPQSIQNEGIKFKRS